MKGKGTFYLLVHKIVVCYSVTHFLIDFDINDKYTKILTQKGFIRPKNIVKS
jgi:hypothetical protein